MRNLRGSLEGVVRIEDTDGVRVMEYGLQNGLLLSERCQSAGGCQPGTLPQDGTYTVIVETTAGTAGSLALRVYQVPNDDERETRIGAPPTLLNLAPGQQASIAFESPAAGAHVLLLLRDIEIRQFEVRLADPDQRPVWPNTKTRQLQRNRGCAPDTDAQGYVHAVLPRRRSGSRGAQRTA